MPRDAPNDRAIDSASSHDNCCDLSALLATPEASMDRVFNSMSSRWNNARACERFRVMRQPRRSYLRAPTPTRSAGRQPGRPEAGKHCQPDDTHRVFAPVIAQSSGKPWMRAAMRTVRRGSPEKSGSGACGAMVDPFTPRSAHARRARVGPRSGPPCFLEPPTSVGAIRFARAAQASAPFHPRSAMRSTRVSPTVGAGCGEGDGYSKETAISLRKPTAMTRGRSWGTPKSEACRSFH